MEYCQTARVSEIFKISIISISLGFPILKPTPCRPLGYTWRATGGHWLIKDCAATLTPRICGGLHPSFNSFLFSPVRRPNSTLLPLRDTPSTIREFPVFLSGCISVSFPRFHPPIPAIGHISHFYPTKSLSGVIIHNRQHAAQEGRCA